MILWHLGLAALVVYVSLGRRRIDYRFVLLGAVLPDLVDPSLAALGGVGEAGGRGPAHSLLAVILVAVVLIVGLRGPRRLAWFGVAVGWLLHLVGDRMWDQPRTFLWPLFGTGFDAVREPWTWDLFRHPLDHFGLWALEAVGVTILAWFWVAFRLGNRDRRRLFLRDGYLRP